MQNCPPDFVYTNFASPPLYFKIETPGNYCKIGTPTKYHLLNNQAIHCRNHYLQNKYQGWPKWPMLTSFLPEQRNNSFSLMKKDILLQKEIICKILLRTRGELYIYVEWENRVTDKNLSKGEKFKWSGANVIFFNITIALCMTKY